jgi:hypothetical protein
MATPSPPPGRLWVSPAIMYAHGGGPRHATGRRYGRQGRAASARGRRARRSSPHRAAPHSLPAASDTEGIGDPTGAAGTLDSVVTADQSAKKPSTGRRLKDWVCAADRFFWLVALGLVPAIYAALRADAERPGWALRSEAVHRFEIGLAVFFGVYLLALALSLAYQGRSIGRLGLPGGAEMDPKDPALSKAAEGMEEFEAETRRSFDEHDESLDDLDRRLVALEDRRIGERLAALEDRLT